MALSGIGSISINQIQQEFGIAPSFGAYRVQWSNTDDGGSLSNQPLDTGIPQSGQISFDNFRGKKLNVVVNFYDVDRTSNPQTGQDIKARFKQGSGVVTSIGGFQDDIPNETDIIGSKIIADVNKKMGARKATAFVNTDTSTCALITGDWAAGQEVVIKVGANGIISGSGGDGGQGGGSGNKVGKEGGRGTSAIGISKGSTSATIINDGQIRMGFGGGGGGGGRGENRRSGKKSSTFVTSSGGGGGGGAGIPFGFGVPGGPPDRGGGPGQSAESFFIGGNGGVPGDSSGAGGHGGDPTFDGGGAGSTRAPSGVTAGASGGLGGLNGSAIITASISLPPISGSGIIIGFNRNLVNDIKL